jgi:hypothetical protein
MKKKNKSKGGFGCSTVIQIVFLILKLGNVVNWPWWFVFAPTYVTLFSGVVSIILLLAVNAWHNK